MSGSPRELSDYSHDELSGSPHTRIFQIFLKRGVSDLSHEEHEELSDSLHKELPKFSSEGLSNMKTSNEGVSDISHEEALSDSSHEELSDSVNTSSQISSHEELADSQIPHVRSFQAGDHGDRAPAIKIRP